MDYNLLYMYRYALECKPFKNHLLFVNIFRGIIVIFLCFHFKCLHVCKVMYLGKKLSTTNKFVCVFIYAVVHRLAQALYESWIRHYVQHITKMY